MVSRSLLVLAIAIGAILAPAAATLAQVPIPDGCARWFDGCNTCGRGPDGTVTCTQKMCARFSTSRCLSWIGQPPGMPEGCAVWFDGCNTCRRTEGGAVACTRRYCAEKQASRCVRQKEPPQ